MSANYLARLSGTVGLVSGRGPDSAQSRQVDGRFIALRGCLGCCWLLALIPGRHIVFGLSVGGMGLIR